MNKERKRPWFVWFTLLLAIMAGLGSAEAALRLIGSQVGAVSWDIFAIPLNGDPHRRSEIPGLIWELAPEVDTVFQEQRVRTNRQGFRDQEYGPKGRGPRVVSLGDSIAFGASVSQEQTYAKVLEQMLKDICGTGVEVINGGVSGYNMTQTAVFYETKARQYDPDLVLLGLFDDDFMPPYIPMEHKIQVAFLIHSHLYRFLAIRIQRLNPVYDSGQNTHIAKSREMGIARLKKLKQRLTEEGRSLLALVHPDLQPGDEDPNRHCSNCEILTGLGISYIDMRPVYLKTGRPLVSFSIRPQGDPHPNAEGHRLIAQAVADYLHGHPSLLLQKCSPNP